MRSHDTVRVSEPKNFPTDPTFSLQATTSGVEGVPGLALSEAMALEAGRLIRERTHCGGMVSTKVLPEPPVAAGHNVMACFSPANVIELIPLRMALAWRRTSFVTSQMLGEWFWRTWAQVSKTCNKEAISRTNRCLIDPGD